jgi:hypothetical protein
VRKLRSAFPFRDKRKENKKNKRQISRSETENVDSDTDEKVEADEEEMELDMQKAIQNARRTKKKRKGEMTLPDINLDNYSVIPGDDTEFDLLGEDGVEDIESDDDQLHIRGLAACQPVWALPLYSLLPSNKQALVSIDSVLHLKLYSSLYYISVCGGCCSVISMVTGLWAGRLWNHGLIPGRDRRLFYKLSRLALWPTQPPVQWAPVVCVCVCARTH